jgi:hypothetical protein
MKLISFSLWGNNPKYTIGAIKNANLAREFYPGWICRFYCANDVLKETIQELRKTSQVVETEDSPNWKFATKRFLPMSEEGIERVIFRDTDSRFSTREVEAVKQWEKEQKILHIMKDHPYHGGFPILAGMFGILGDYIPNIESMIKKAENEIQEQYHFDQIFLDRYIWKLFKSNVTIHDEFFSNKPFPVKRNKFDFVGQVYDENDIINQEHMEILRRYYDNKQSHTLSKQ